MSEHHHPIWDHMIVVYHCAAASPGHEYRAFFGTGRAFPLYFDAATFQDAKAKAEAFRAETTEKHEKAFINRQNALDKANAARKAKAS